MSEGVRATRFLAEQIERNRRWTAVLIGVAAANGALIAAVVASSSAGAFFLVIGAMAACVAITYFVYLHLVKDSTGARAPSDDELATLAPAVTRLAKEFGISKPAIMVIDDDAANAFAVGPSSEQGTVVFTSGIINTLAPDQLEAVAAHEIAHVANGDTRVSMLSASFLGWALAISWVGSAIAIGMIAVGAAMMTSDGGDDDDSGVLAGLAAGVATMVVAALAFVGLQVWFLLARVADLAIHRQREYLADATAVKVTRRPEALAGALEVLDGTNVTLARGGRLAQPLCIAGERPTGRFWRDLLSSHPSSAARVARIRAYRLTVPASSENLSSTSPSSTAVMMPFDVRGSTDQQALERHGESEARHDPAQDE